MGSFLNWMRFLNEMARQHTPQNGTSYQFELPADSPVTAEELGNFMGAELGISMGDGTQLSSRADEIRYVKGMIRVLPPDDDHGYRVRVILKNAQHLPRDHDWSAFERDVHHHFQQL